MKKFKLKKEQRFLINFDEAEFLDEVFSVEERNEALSQGADDVTGSKYHEEKFKRQKRIDSRIDEEDKLHVEGSFRVNNRGKNEKD